MGRKRFYISGLSRLLAAYPQPVYVLDANRVVVYCNTACLDWTRATVDEIVGRRCDYHSHNSDDGTPNLLGGLCPPPEVFQGRPITTTVACADPDGHWIDRPAECLPLADSQGGCQGVIVFICADDLARISPSPSHVPPPEELHRQLRNLIFKSDASNQVSQIIGQSPAMRRVAQQVKFATGGDARVLISGPPGSGREMIARAVHYGGAASSSPLMPLACNLLDSELFDSTIAAFAASCVELNNERPAALLLLEVDQLPSDAQASLAKMLTKGELNLRTIATARTPLIELARRNEYRSDLAFALSTLAIQPPPLAERIEDVPLLAQHFLEQENARGGKQLTGFSEETLDALVAYPWPENVDELRKLILQSCAAATGPLVQITDLPERIGVTAAANAHPAAEDPSIKLDEYLAEIERELLVRSVQWAKGNKAQAARLLGISRARLLRRLGHFGI